MFLTTKESCFFWRGENKNTAKNNMVF